MTRRVFSSKRTLYKSLRKEVLQDFLYYEEYKLRWLMFFQKFLCIKNLKFFLEHPEWT